MYKLILFLTSILFASTCFGAIHSVIGTPGSSAVVKTANTSLLQNAINNASQGDSIYVYPSYYNNITIQNKKLALIGKGYAPNNDTSVLNRTNIAAISIYNGTTKLSDGCQFMGLIIDYLTIGGTSSAEPIDDITIRRNIIQNIEIYYPFASANPSDTTVNDYLIEGNIIHDFQFMIGNSSLGFNFYDFLITNNVIDGFNDVSRKNLMQGNFVVSHNLFVGINSIASLQLYNCKGISFEDNIFHQGNISTIGQSNNSFKNNSTYASVNINQHTNSPWTLAGNIDLGNNIVEQAQVMTSNNALSNPPISSITDFTVSSGGAKNSASDGKDRGLLFDLNVGLNFVNSRNALLPRITNFQGATLVPANSNFNINLSATQAK